MMLTTVSLSAQNKYFNILEAKENNNSFTSASGTIALYKIGETDIITIYDASFTSLYNFAVIKETGFSDRIEIKTIDKESNYILITIKEYKNHIIWKFKFDDGFTFTIKTTNYYL